MRLALPLVAFAVFVLAAYMPSSDASQSKGFASEVAPDWENLQVLPDSISRDALFDIMKGFTQALGVRCDHCHINEGDSFETFNFPSDDNSHKEVARDMMRMTWQINNDPARDRGARSSWPSEGDLQHLPSGLPASRHGDGP